jgi:hypothetical protein
MAPPEREDRSAMMLDDALFVLIGSGIALSALDLFYRLQRRATMRRSARKPRIIDPLG